MQSNTGYDACVLRCVWRGSGARAPLGGAKKKDRGEVATAADFEVKQVIRSQANRSALCVCARDIRTHRHVCTKREQEHGNEQGQGAGDC